jgi:O-methyltransferase
MVRRFLRKVQRRVYPIAIRADAAAHRPFGLAVSEYHKGYPIVRPIASDNVEILADAAFTESCREVAKLTIIDTPRLANLWELCRMTDPDGAIIEVGAFRGGSALHLSNSSPGRQIVVCDSFSGFGKLDTDLDGLFGPHMFTDTSRETVEHLFQERGRDALVLAGLFPASACDVELPPLSFCHLDVDVYDATRESLEFIVPRLLPRSLIVLDDYNRRASGVNKALAEFVDTNAEWTLFPLFPAQALLVNREWFAAKTGAHVNGSYGLQA